MRGTLRSEEFSIDSVALLSAYCKKSHVFVADVRGCILISIVELVSVVRSHTVSGIGKVVGYPVRRVITIRSYGGAPVDDLGPFHNYRDIRDPGGKQSPISLESNI